VSNGHPSAGPVPARALVIGTGVTGRAMAVALVAHGSAVTITDDDTTEARRAVATEVGATWVDPPGDESGWRALVADHDGVLPSPGVPERHPVFAAARAVDRPVRSELDLAAVWDERRVVLITGTNGKTTVTMLVTEMLRASGLAAMACGNLEVPLVTAIEDPAPDVFVVEVSSFRLTFASAHRPLVATWLNFAPDHLDVHLDLAGYEEAKARIWLNHDVGVGSLAVVNADDPVVVAHAPAGERTQTFGLSSPADWRVVDGRLIGPGGIDLVAVDDLPRSLPHDIANSLAAAATAFGAGGSLDGIRSALGAFRGLPHRVELVGEAGGVRWYDDSKATAPHATVAALAGFESAVLVAGGRNKGIDLRALTAAPHVKAVVGIGEAGPEIVEAFGRSVPTAVAASMDEAVAAAAGFAEPGDAVVLSPACASYDWYRSYVERGDDFQRAVRAHLADRAGETAR
jgi:UDP-N-acetylmuramoylalanine--D-glutamate ligase